MDMTKKTLTMRALADVELAGEVQKEREEDEDSEVEDDVQDHANPIHGDSWRGDDNVLKIGNKYYRKFDYIENGVKRSSTILLGKTNLVTFRNQMLETREEEEDENGRCYRKYYHYVQGERKCVRVPVNGARMEEALEVGAVSGRGLSEEQEMMPPPASPAVPRPKTATPRRDYSHCHPFSPRSPSLPPGSPFWPPGLSPLGREEGLPDCRALPAHLFSPARQQELGGRGTPKYQDLSMDYMPPSVGSVDLDMVAPSSPCQGVVKEIEMEEVELAIAVAPQAKLRPVSPSPEVDVQPYPDADEVAPEVTEEEDNTEDSMDVQGEIEGKEGSIAIVSAAISIPWLDEALVQEVQTSQKAWRFSIENPKSPFVPKVQVLLARDSPHHKLILPPPPIKVEEPQPQVKIKKKTPKKREHNDVQKSPPTFKKVNIRCEQCGRKCTSLAMIREHACKPRLQCHDCLPNILVLPSRPELLHHLDTEHPGLKIVCDLCGKIYPSKTLLKGHMRLHKLGVTQTEPNPESTTASIEEYPSTNIVDPPDVVEEHITKTSKPSKPATETSTIKPVNAPVQSMAGTSAGTPGKISIFDIPIFDLASETEEMEGSVDAPVTPFHNPPSVQEFLPPPSVPSAGSPITQSTSSNQEYKCAGCGKMFQTFLRHRNHALRCHPSSAPPPGRRLVKVEPGLLRASRRNARFEQMKVNWRETQKDRERCGKCARTNYTEDTLDRHLRVCKGSLQETSESLPCQFCSNPPRTFTSDLSLQRHLTSTHCEEMGSRRVRNTNLVTRHLFREKAIPGMPANDIIRLNVGGKSLATTRTTLLSDPGSCLARMFQEDSPIPPAILKDGEHFLDVDPRSFEVVLTWLRHRTLVIPPDLPQEAVALLADCYCLSSLLAMVRPPPSPRPMPIDSTLSSLNMLQLCPHGGPFSQQVPDKGGKWVCTNRLHDTLSIPYFKLGPLLGDRQNSQTDLQLRVTDLVVCLDTTLQPKLCLTQGNDPNIWANRFGLVLHLHHLEYVTWIFCDTASIPPSALAFSKTQSGLERYLGFIQERGEVLLGVVVEGRGIRLFGRDHGSSWPGFHVLATGKSWDL